MPTIHAREMPIYASLAVAPSAVDYGVGPAWIGGIIFWSDGSTWISGLDLYDANQNTSHFSQIMAIEIQGTTPLLVGSAFLQPGTYAPKAKVGCSDPSYAASLLIKRGVELLSTTGAVIGTIEWRNGEVFTVNEATDINFFLVGNSINALAFLQGIIL